MKKFLLLFMLAGIFSFNVNAQGTVLAPGDIAIVHYQSDSPDAFAFVTFVELAAGTTIYFSDCGATSAGIFLNPCTEGVVVFVAAAVIPAGTMLFENDNTGDAQFSDFPASSDAGISGSFALGTTGDQISAYQDADGAGGTDPSLNPTFLFAVNGASTMWNGDPTTSSSHTSLPTGLTDGSTAVAVGSGSGASEEVDNSVFNPVNMPYSTAAAALADITDPSNWVSASDDSDPIFAGHVATMMAQGNALPVELVSFRAIAMTDEVKLQWKTASEENNKGFEIERSSNNRDWENLDFVEGFGTTAEINQYDFMDENPNRGLNYYRLKQVDYDGAYEYSQVRVAEWNDGDGAVKYEISVSPNPATNAINISLPDDLIQSKALNFEVFNQLGQLLSTERKTIGDATAIQLDINDLAEGFYFLRIQEKNQQYTASFIKQ